MTSETVTLDAVKAADVGVLYFSAPWCGPCRNLGPIVEAYAAAHPSVPILKVNVDDDRATAAEYRVRAIPTLVLLKQGAVIAQRTGFVTEAILNEFVTQ